MIEDTPASYKARMQAHAETTLGAVAKAAKTAAVECETVQVEHEHPYKAIIDTAESKDCDLIVMASHGRHGISALVLGRKSVWREPMRFWIVPTRQRSPPLRSADP